MTKGPLADPNRDKQLGADGGNENKDQHWIPKNYLKAWCDPHGQNNIVHRYDREGRYIDWRPYSKLTSSNDVYTIFREDGTRDLRTERLLGKLEDSFARVAKFVSGGRRHLHRRQAVELAWFIAAMRERLPKARDHWQGFLDRVIATGTAIEGDLRGLSPGEKKRRVKALAGPAGPRGDPWLSLDEVRSLSGRGFGAWLPTHIRIAGQIMENMEVMILDAPAGHSFITSDNPVVWWSPLIDRHPFGLGLPTIEITMPITPRVCALLTHSGGNGRADAPQTAVRAINFRTMLRCDTHIYANCATVSRDWFGE